MHLVFDRKIQIDAAPGSPRHRYLVSAECWPDAADHEAVIARAIDAAAEAVADPATSGAEIAVMLTDDAGIRTLNRDLARDRQVHQCAVVSAAPPAGPGDATGAPRMLATSRSPMRRRGERPRPNTSRSRITSATSRCTDSCI